MQNQAGRETQASAVRTDSTGDGRAASVGSGTAFLALLTSEGLSLLKHSLLL